MKIFSATLMLVSVIGLTGCSSTFMPLADPARAELKDTQSQELAKRKFQVPCRVSVHCASSLVGLRDSAFFTDYYYYPLQDILRSSFTSATYKVFEPARGEIIDSFVMHVTVPESNLDIAWGKANYVIQVIVSFNEPGGRKVMAKSFMKHVQLPLKGNNEVPEAVYQACRDVAFEALSALVESPELQRTVKRFEDR